MIYTIQNFRLFLISNISVLNFRISLLMYPGWLSISDQVAAIRWSGDIGGAPSCLAGALGGAPSCQSVCGACSGRPAKPWGGLSRLERPAAAVVAKLCPGRRSTSAGGRQWEGSAAHRDELHNGRPQRLSGTRVGMPLMDCRAPSDLKWRLVSIRKPGPSAAVISISSSARTKIWNIVMSPLPFQYTLRPPCPV